MTFYVVEAVEMRIPPHLTPQYGGSGWGLTLESLLRGYGVYHLY